MKTTEKQILLFDGHRGVYIPKNFAEECTTNWHNVSDEDRKVLLNGPDEESYWDVWNDVLDNAYYQEPSIGDEVKPKYTLYQNDDCWAILEGYYIGEDEQLHKHMNEGQLDRMANAFEKFRDAYQELTKTWIDEEFDGDEFTEDYPFKESFDEIEIDKWVKTSLEKINSQY